MATATVAHAVIQPLCVTANLYSPAHTGGEMGIALDRSLLFNKAHTQTTTGLDSVNKLTQTIQECAELQSFLELPSIRLESKTFFCCEEKITV